MQNGNYTSRTVENSKSYEILDTIAGNYEIEVFSVSPSGLRSVQSAKLVTGNGNFFVANGKTAPHKMLVIVYYRLMRQVRY